MAEPTPPGDKPAPKPAPAEKPAAVPAAAEKPAPAKPAAAAKPAPARPAAGKPGAKAAAPAAPVEMAAPTMKAEIRARLRKGRPARFDVKADGSVLGRDDAAGVAIPLDGVSREHARIKWDGKGWWLEDLKSTNGTFVNGEKVLRERLQHLDVISLGRKADLVFLLRSMDTQVPATRPGVVRAALVDADDGTVYEIAVGEFTLGRSSACNLVANENAVSKVHARIDRAADQVVLEDLSSSNGTFVNGTRVRTAILRDTDTLELANVAKYKVVIEQGEVGATGLYRAPTFAKKEEQPKFSGEWKTRYEWDPAELAAIAAAAAGQRPPELDKKGQAEPPAGPKHVVQGQAKKAPPAAAPAVAPKPVAAALKAAVPAPPPAAAKPATPANEKVVPRPVKTEAPADDRPKGTPPPARPSTPAGTDPASTPKSPALDPRPEKAPPSPIVPAVEPAAAAPKPVIPSPRTAAPPPPRSPAATPPADLVAGSTVVDTAAPVIPSSPSSGTPARIATARFTSEKFSFDVTTTGRFEVGRSASTAFRVDHTTVSRRHAALVLSEDRAHLVVEDLGAANGTRVNGVEIKGTRELQDRDVLEMGEVRFTVRFERA
jgi:pSer/pThr/pTyr-binding forkhead associated (FHA) protein